MKGVKVLCANKEITSQMVNIRLVGDGKFTLEQTRK
jgi:hypothetical protein